jgi:RNA recognition motif-containing protein
MTTKVFVGNLDFQTTDQALADAFVDCGKVKSGVIITRGRRSLGYGFVEFESAEAADKAVTTKNGTELSNRQIKVELVRDPAPDRTDR